MLKVKNTFKVKDSEETIVTEHDKEYVIMFRNEQSSAIYEQFDSQLNIYLNKISGQNKTAVKQLLDRKVICLGLNPKKTSNTLGMVIDQNNKLYYIVLDSTILDIDLNNGVIGDIEETINATYYQFIRFIATSNPSFKKNDTLNELIIKYYCNLLLKFLKLTTQSDKQIELAKYIISIMYYKCFLDLNVTLASEKSLKLIKPEFIHEFESLVDLKLIEKYNDIKDILKLLIDFKVTFETPNTLMYNLLMGLKTTSFLSVTISYDLLIAGIITSLYSQNFYKHLLVNKNIQTQIETIISKAYNNVKFEDTSKLQYIKTTVEKDGK